MRVLTVRNVHSALPLGMKLLLRDGIRRGSRNGPVLTFPEPVCTVYEKPEERVLFWSARDANPFFHLLESLWMLAGRKDVAYLKRLLPSMANYSDDGETFHGAYGYRWRVVNGGDQLHTIVQALKENHEDRRQVLQIWDSYKDLGNPSKDVPCNLTVHFQVTHEGKLDMTVFNRSNDMLWGAYGANAVHFSVLMEYVAAGVGVPMGKYRQISDNMHAYTETDVFVRCKLLEEFVQDADVPFELNQPYEHIPVTRLINSSWENWNYELGLFMEGDGSRPELYEDQYQDSFFSQIALPMFKAYAFYKAARGELRYEGTLNILQNMPDCDWKVACLEWVERRYVNWQTASADGVRYE